MWYRLYAWVVSGQHKEAVLSGGEYRPLHQQCVSLEEMGICRLLCSR